MTGRSVVLHGGLRRLMEGNSRSAASSLRYFSESKGRILSEEERAKEIVYIQKMEREKMEKLRGKIFLYDHVDEFIFVAPIVLSYYFFSLIMKYCYVMLQPVSSP
ncbi:hypothetical protein ACS0TY_004453 [Phlomoides rotata]